MDDWRFFVGRKSNKGVSISSLLFGVSTSIILLLYLHDAGTSSLILCSILKDVIFGLWKVFHILKLKFKWSQWYFVSLPFITCPPLSSSSTEEAETSVYDRIAFVHVSLTLAPLVAGISLHSLCFARYKSWWSWVISSLADGVYYVGFASMVPQLYINYR